MRRGLKFYVDAPFFIPPSGGVSERPDEKGTEIWSTWQGGEYLPRSRSKERPDEKGTEINRDRWVPSGLEGSKERPDEKGTEMH